MFLQEVSLIKSEFKKSCLEKGIRLRMGEDAFSQLVKPGFGPNDRRTT